MLVKTGVWWGEGVFLASSGQRPGGLLNTLQCTGQPPQGRIFCLNVSEAEAGKRSILRVGNGERRLSVGPSHGSLGLWWPLYGSLSWTLF